MTRDQLRFQQLAKAARIQGATRQYGLIVSRRGMRVAPPQLHELGEVLINDFGAIEAFVAGGDGRGSHDGEVSRE
jgi:hypothetical protein